MTVHELADRVTRLRAYYDTLTDRAILGSLLQPQDRGMPWVEGSNNYTWWRAIGATVQPRSLVEIGTRFGYSLKAVLGTQFGVRPSILVVDDERDADVAPLTVFLDYFRDCMGILDITVRRTDSQKLSTLRGYVGSGFDLASVDADHSADGCYHDCGLVWEVLRPGGLMAVDDTQPGDVRDGCERFCRDNGVAWAFLPSLRGIHLVLKPE